MPVLDLVLSHLRPSDVASLRLAARCLRSHRAVLGTCDSVTYPQKTSMSAFQAGLPFLQQLPKLDELCLVAPWTLIGIDRLNQLTELEIFGSQGALDLYSLSLLPMLDRLVIKDCSADRLANLSEVTSITELLIEQSAANQAISRLTNLSSLAIWTREETVNTAAWVTLQRLTSLADNAMGKDCWHTLPLLEILEISTCPGSLQAIRLPERLRGLAMDTGLDEGEGPITSNLDPLSALLHLEHLDLTGTVSRLPVLNALTMLTIQFGDAEDSLPDISGAPLLQVLELWLSDSDVVLPQLAGLTSLSTVYFNDDEGGCLLRNVRSPVEHAYKYVDARRSVRLADLVKRD